MAKASRIFEHTLQGPAYPANLCRDRRRLVPPIVQVPTLPKIDMEAHRGSYAEDGSLINC